jgi:cytochrome P450
MLKKTKDKRLPLPPKIDIGLPLLGPVIPFTRDMMGTFDEMHARYGNTFRTKLVRLPLIFLLGPEAIDFILRDREGNFSAREGWSLFLDHVFPGAILAQDGAEHLRLRRIMQGAFGADAMKGYLQGMHPAIARGLSELGENSRSKRFRFFPFIKQLTLNVATTTFAGMKLDSDADKLNRAFVDAVEASLAIVRLPLPGTKMGRGLRGRRMLEQAYSSVLAEKRANATPDLFSRLCHAKSEDGAVFSDKEVIDQMIFVMMAAHDTSTSTLTTMTYLLAKHPEWQERLRGKALAYDSDELRSEDMDAQEELTWVIKEALRLYPPLTSMPRKTVREITWDGYRIPKDAIVGAFPFFNHRMEELWSNPKAFDPERFSAERREDKSHRYAWTPFGAGAHTCIGQHFGMMEIRAIMHRMLRTYRWTAAPGYEMPVQLVPIVKPKDGLPISMTPLRTVV